MASTINISDIRLFNLMKSKFGEKEAEEFVSLVKEEIEETVTIKHESVSKDIVGLREDFSSLKEDFSGLREDLFNHFASKDFVASKVSEAKFQIILWAFVFWVTQLGAIFAFLKIFIK